MRGMSKLSKGARRLAAGTMAAVIALFQTGMSAVKVMAADETGYEEAIVVVNEDNPYQITIMRNPDAGDTTHPWVPYIYRWYDPEMMYSGEQRFLSLGEALIKDYCANNGLTESAEMAKQRSTSPEQQSLLILMTLRRSRLRSLWNCPMRRKHRHRYQRHPHPYRKQHPGMHLRI